jgi:hypothetical protein
VIGYFGVVPFFPALGLIILAVYGLFRGVPLSAAGGFTLLALWPIIGCVLLLTPPSRQYFDLYPNLFGPYGNRAA